MARGKAHSDEVRAAVMSALLAGQSVGEIAKEYRIHHSVVSRWRNRLPSNQLHEVAHKKGADFAALLAEYLSTLLVALTAQAVTLADPAYIRGQSAAEMAILHGVIADKAIRILEAVSPSYYVGDKYGMSTKYHAKRTPTTEPGHREET